MAQHRSGGKVGRSHTTVIDAAVPVVDKAAKLEEVTKISLGVLKMGLPSAPHRISFAPITGGLKVKARGGTSIQELFVYTTKPGRTQHQLTKSFKGG